MISRFRTLGVIFGAAILTLAVDESFSQTFNYTGEVVTNPGITDISGTGTLLGAGDDVVYDVSLGGPGFSFFGTTFSDLSVSTNGTITPDLLSSSVLGNTSLPTGDSNFEDGVIAVLWDDITDGNIYFEYFAASPYANPNGSATNSYVFQWDDTRHFGGSGTFDIQATLFTDGNLLFLYGPGNPEEGSGSTTGVQGPGGAAAEFFEFASNTPGSIPANLALYLFHELAKQSVLVTDLGAINSLRTTGSLFPSVQQQSVQNASQTATSDLNNRLFRARSGKPQTQDSASNDAPISRYLDFAARNKIGYKFAIGLEDEDRTAEHAREVQEHSTLEEGDGALQSERLTFTREVPIGDKVVFEDSVFRNWEAFADVDYGFYDQDDLSAIARGFRSDSYAATLGVEHRLLPWLYVGGAVSRLQNDTDLTANLGGSELDGTLLSTYFTAFHEEFYFDFLYSYGSYDNETFRNTLTGATALGATDSQSETVDINIGYVHQWTDQIRTGPIAGFNYTLGQIDGYTETGGGSANLVYGDSDFDSMITRLGWQVTATDRLPFALLTAQLTAQFAHEFRPQGGTTQVSLLNSPFTLGGQSVGGFGTTVNTPHVGQDWLELGTAVRLDLENQWNISLDYSGQFGRNNASAHFVGGRIGYEW